MKKVHAFDAAQLRQLSRSAARFLLEEFFAKTASGGFVKYVQYENAYVKVSDPQAVGEWLDKLPNKTSVGILEAARDPRSPMHGEIEWDDSRAAYQYRLTQVRHIVGSIAIESGDYQVRAFESVVIGGATQYASISKISKSTSLIDQVIESAISELSYWKLKHQRLSRHFGRLFDEITKAEVAYRSKREKGKKGRKSKRAKGRDEVNDTSGKEVNRARNDRGRLSVTRKQVQREV